MNLEILYWMQSVRSPFLDRLCEALSLLAEPVPLAFLFCAIYWCRNKQLGRNLILGLSVSLCVNGLLKDTVRAARPIGQPGVVSHRVESATGYSFPSAHAQTAASFYGMLALYPKRSVLRALLLGLLVLGVGYSRCYLGLHYPIDVLGGWALGLTLSFVVFLMNKLPGTRILLGVLCIVLAAWSLLIGSSGDTVSAGGLALGVLPGLLLEEKCVRFHPTEDPNRAVVRLLGGVALMGVLFLGPRFLFPRTQALDAVTYALVAFAATGGWPWLFTRLESTWIRKTID